ncbi:MAG: hypothetical protein PVF74_04850, partial [Anaerolineales bacterium]
SCRVPGCGHRPKLIHPDQRSHWVSISRTPLPHLFFRPEEEHVVSGEDDIVPPICSWNQAVEEPVGVSRTIQTHLQV